MDQLAELVNILTVVTLISGVLFAAFELRGSRRESRRQSQILLLRSFESPEFVKGMRRLLDLPDNLSRAEIEKSLGREGIDLLWFWLGTMESFGILVFNREIDIHTVDQSFGGPVIISWQKLHRYANEVRRDTGRESMHEWYQWLAEQLERLERQEGRTAAHLREKEWRP
ncbi:MAG: hypothetical protein QFC55_05050 [Chloroflexota bacterium]|nr:hypothetical protein [Chloroflexota bacterium]